MCVFEYPRNVFVPSSPRDHIHPKRLTVSRFDADSVFAFAPVDVVSIDFTWEDGCHSRIKREDCLGDWHATKAPEGTRRQSKGRARRVFGDVMNVKVQASAGE